MPNKEFFHRNPKLLGLGGQFGKINFGAFGGIFGRFISTHFGTVSPLSMFSSDQPWRAGIGVYVTERRYVFKPDMLNHDLRSLSPTYLLCLHKNKLLYRNPNIYLGLRF